MSSSFLEKTIFLVHQIFEVRAEPGLPVLAQAINLSSNALVPVRG